MLSHDLPLTLGAINETDKQLKYLFESTLRKKKLRTRQNNDFKYK